MKIMPRCETATWDGYGAIAVPRFFRLFFLMHVGSVQLDGGMYMFRRIGRGGDFATAPEKERRHETDNNEHGRPTGWSHGGKSA